MKIKPVISLLLRVLIRVFLFVIALYLAFMLVVMFWPAIGGSTRGNHVRQQKRFAAMFEAGNTNAPLLAMDWFSEHGVYFCRVSQSGNVFSARDVGHAIQGGSGISSRFSLDNTNRPLLETAINNLPPSSKKSLPKERQILISGIRSNQWFERIYDRANVPPEVEKLYEMTDAYLGWFIPFVGSHPEGVQHGMSPNTFAIAKDTSYAVSICANYGLQIWNLDGKSPSKAALLDKLPYPWKGDVNYLWGIATFSPNGQVIIFAVRDVLFAVDWQNQKILWETNQIAWGNTYHASGKTIAVGNHGQSLFIAEANSVERWNLADGTKQSTLATNDTGIKFLQTSWNGGLLVVGFGDNSFTVWNTDKDESVFRFTEPAGVTCLAISPNDQQIVLNAFGQKTMVIYDWQRGVRKEIPLRTPYASHSAYSLCWSPDGTRLAAHIDTYPSSIIIYETTSWKPIADWPCGAMGSHSEYVFNKDGRLFQMMDGEVNNIDVTKLKSVGD